MEYLKQLEFLECF